MFFRQKWSMNHTKQWPGRCGITPFFRPLRTEGRGLLVGGQVSGAVAACGLMTVGPGAVRVAGGGGNSTRGPHCPRPRAAVRSACARTPGIALCRAHTPRALRSPGPVATPCAGAAGDASAVRTRWRGVGCGAAAGGGGGAHRNTARQAMDGLWTEVCGQQKQSNDPGNNQHILNTPIIGRR